MAYLFFREWGGGGGAELGDMADHLFLDVPLQSGKQILQGVPNSQVTVTKTSLVFWLSDVHLVLSEILIQYW
jgi:hypothetical protein